MVTPPLKLWRTAVYNTLMLLVVLSTVCLAMLAIGTLVLVKNPRDRANQSLFFFQLLVVSWIIANTFTSDTSLGTTTVASIDRAVMALPGASLYFLLIFALAFTRTYQRLSQLARTSLALVAFIVVCLCATTAVVSGVERVGSQNIVIFGPLAAVYVAYTFSFFTATVIVLFRHFLRASAGEKVRTKYVLASLFLSVGIIVVTNLLLPVLGNNFSLVPYGPLFTIIIIAGLAYAIVKHRLFNIRFIIARSISYLLLLATIAVAYGALIFTATRLFFSENQVSSAQMTLSIALAVVMAFTFQPLHRFFSRITNRVFFRDHYDSQVVINSFSKIMVSELDLNRILKRSITELCENLHIQFGQLVIFNNDRVYRVEHYGTLPKRLMVAPELRRLTKPMLIADELEGGEHKQLMEHHGIRVSVALRTRDEFIGYLLLGDKLSGDIYSNQDIKLLEIIANELAVAISNAKAYAQIQEFNLTLQARVDHATNRLRVANRHLKELDRAKDEFISMASHQLRTPLTTIKGYLSMMLEGDAGRLTKPQAEFVNYAFGSSERMVNLISDLLNVSRLSAGRFLIQTKPTDMVGMIADEVRQLQTHANAKRIKLIFEPPPEPLPPAEIDDNKTRQVVMNFIDNAIYYTQTGEVRVVLEQSGDKVRLEVRDTGIGVPEKAKRKLFSKFFRADNAQIIRPDGTGLGLYLAKRVVEDQGGTIIFSSVEGKGSTFGFELPFKPITQPHEVPHARAHHAPKN